MNDLCEIITHLSTYIDDDNGHSMPDLRVTVKTLGTWMSESTDSESSIRYEYNENSNYSDEYSVVTEEEEDLTLEQNSTDDLWKIIYIGMVVIMISIWSFSKRNVDDWSISWSVRLPVAIRLWKAPFGKDVTQIFRCKNLAHLKCNLVMPKKPSDFEPTVASKYDAILVHQQDNRDIRWRDTPFKTDQKPAWIWWNFESRSWIGNLAEADDFFHLTASFKAGSDIYVPYGRLIRRPKPLLDMVFDVHPKLVCWVVSNYQGWHPRSRYFKILRTLVPVDIYGRGSRWSVPLKGDIIDTIKQYKFYLSFENSAHDDYITEKVWTNALLAHTIPIVMGPPRANYEKHIPGDSFIHVDDFPGIPELANYLNQVAANHTLLMSYLEFHKYYEVQSNEIFSMSLCAICDYLLTNVVNYTSRRKLSSWFT